MLLPAAAALLAGCGGGGGGGGVVAPAAPAPLPQPAPPPMTTERCVETADFGCLSNTAYLQRREVIASRHRDDGLFWNQWGLETIGADKAWADVELLRGAGTTPGTDVTVGFIDTGIDQGHPFFAGRSIPETFLDGAADEDGSFPSHGTGVASVVGAAPGASCSFRHVESNACVDFRGVAPGANLRMFAVPLEGGRPPDQIILATRPGELADDDAGDAALYGRVLLPSENLDVLNLSFGLDGLIDNYTEAQLRAGYGGAIAALAQAGASRKTLLVWAAGNSNGELCLSGSPYCAGSDLTGIDPTDGMTKAAGRLDARSPNVLAGLVARIPELRGHSVAVVSVGADGAISSFSNRCGVAADWCIAAPGGDVDSPVSAAYFGPIDDPPVPPGRDVALEIGTSFAAPMVAGGLAVMRHLFRDQLSNEELLTRLFRTADKSGVYTDRAIYGQGLMDLGAAASPVGEMRFVAGGGSTGDAGHPLGATRLVMGAPLGDGLVRALGGVEIAAMDTLGAPFWFDSSAFTLAARGGTSNERRLHGLAARHKEARAPHAGWGFGLYESPVASGSSLLNLAENAMTLSWRTTPGRLEVSAFAASGPGRHGNDAPDRGLALAWRPPDSPFGVRLGWLREDETALGSKSGGAFGCLSADSLVAGVGAEAALGGWRFATEAEAGFSWLHAGGGMLAGFSDVTTSAMALSARRRLGTRDAVTLSVSQPPRVESGHARLVLPVGRDRSGRILGRSFSAGLAPSGRQIDFSARWRRADTLGGELSVEAVRSRHPGHASNTPSSPPGRRGGETA